MMRVEAGRPSQSDHVAPLSRVKKASLRSGVQTQAPPSAETTTCPRLLFGRGLEGVGCHVLPLSSEYPMLEPPAFAARPTRTMTFGLFQAQATLVVFPKRGVS